MLDRHQRRLNDIANREGPKKGAVVNPMADYAVKLNENKKIIHEIQMQCKG
jgi:hypothetical protein